MSQVTASSLSANKYAGLIFREFVGLRFHNCTLLHFFKLQFGFPAANFGPFSRGQPHLPDVNHCILKYFDPKVTWSLITGWVTKHI